MTNRVTLTLIALVSFALNSLLCRAALGAGLIDASSFTLVRLAAGAAVLAVVAGVASAGTPRAAPGPRAGSAGSAAALFFYALPFSLAYRGLSAGTGAFVVFGCVQATMLGADLISGGRLRLREIGGLSLSLIGLFVLTRPGQESPDPVSVLLMAVAGFSWGVYSLRGRNSGPPIQATARNFAMAVPLALAAALAATLAGLATAHASPKGLLLAAVSGAVTSGLGYAAWYAALPSLSKPHAAIVQLAVPPLAAALGVLLLGETLGPRLWVAAPMILGGIALAVLGTVPSKDD